MTVTKRLAMAAMALCCMTASSSATTPDILISGQVAPALEHGTTGWCAVTQGTSSFQSNATATVAVITFPELTLLDGAGYHMLNGLGQMTFASAKAGTIKFVDSGMSSHFDGFRESFDGTVYHVSFTLTFMNTCKLPIAALYESP